MRSAYGVSLMGLVAGRPVRRRLRGKSGRLLLALVLVGLCASSTIVTGQVPETIPEPVEHHLSQKAVEIARPLGFPITNSMVVTWIVAVGLIIFAQAATRTMSQVP
ncbi:MAG TPA: hypothetical protein VH701_11310, partial [Vicinamibacterales bacterium]